MCSVYQSLCCCACDSDKVFLIFFFSNLYLPCRMSSIKVLDDPAADEKVLCSPKDHPIPSIPFIGSSVLLIILGFILTILLYVGDMFGTRYVGFDLKDPAINQPHLPNTINGMVNVALTLVITVGALFYMNLSKTCRMGVRWCIQKALLQITFMMFGVCVVNILTNFVKHYYGEPRPHFIAVCQPNLTDPVTIAQLNGGSYVTVNLSRTICTADSKNLDYRWAFPSGHSSQVR